MGANYRETSIIVACRNEEQIIERCLAKLVQSVPEAEIVVVDGGTDNTFAKAQQMAKQWHRIKPIRNQPDFGKGHGVRQGIAAASGRIMAQFDADLQFYTEDLPALLDPVATGQVDLALGSRFLPGSNRAAYRPIFWRDIGNRLISFYVSMLIGRRVTDVTSGIKAWTRSAIERIDFRDPSCSYEVEIVVRAARLGLRIRDVPVRYADRNTGRSMHRNSWAVGKAGAIMAVNALRSRMRRD
jgi:glycosyltransferase involved in cell wall biosynthesis